MITNYAEESRKDSNLFPFQDILILIHDRKLESTSYDATIDFEIILKNHVHDSPEVKAVKNLVHSTFENVSCFFLPPMVDKVKNNVSYDGRWSQMNENYKIGLMKMISTLLKPSNLKVKKVNGHELTSQEFVDMMNVYFEIFQSP